MKYYLIAGESSGDMYGAALMKALQSFDNDAQFRFWGGPRMRAVSDTCDVSIEETSFMGLLEVLKKSRHISSLFRRAKEDIEGYSPDITIHIDYPGFNLRMMRWAKKRGYKTAYYISPQIWAWRKYRFKTIRDFADLFFPILPFEKTLYHKLGINCPYYGHPLLESYPTEQSSKKIEGIQTIGIFPGSRRQEIEMHLPVISEFMRRNENYDYIISIVDHLPESLYDRYLRDLKHIKVTDKEDAMNMSDIALACSGTVTLELGLKNIPQVVFYKTSAISYAIARRMVRVPFISLVNLILERAVVPELIQSGFTPKAIKNSIGEKLEGTDLSHVYAGYSLMRNKLGDGNTSIHIARDIFKFISPTT